MDVIALIATVLSAGSAALFLLVGATVQRRDVSQEARTAKAGFVVWWYGIGALSVVGLVQTLPGFPLDLQLFLAMTALLLGVLCVALAGLIHYLVFLYTSRNLLPFIAAGYAAFFAVFLLFIAASEPTSVESSRWGPSLEYANEIDSGPFFLAVVLLLLAPPIVSAAAYLRLYRVVGDPALKRRILLVSLSIIVWFGSSLLGTLPGADTESGAWRIASRLVGLAAAATILYAYAGLRPSVPSAGGSSKQVPHDSFFDPPKGEVSRAVPHVLRVLP